MQIVEMNDGPKASYALSGSELVVGGLSIDIDERQSDVETVISLYAGPSGITEQPDPTGPYVAIITIPPATYTMEEVEDIEDGQPVQVMVPVRDTANTDAVSLRLWSLGV